MHLLTCNLEPK